ncbi:tRNA synthetase class I [Sodiomyces alkalinus F11]|uniref:Tyrosine--tRNA ligase n=1 Tax=Sodiomyces alkalinus (strain CBS 110278 / VKM F-3762 / F11) TaxID=1314773 RepID=A0A3N2QAC1_SODAK|nr:tRNA synthetase class I [Sodiomyces alkalinus F11]ROT43618.1 tRNA synthetase class I [Sodiomyces alkalinus F11]
MSQALQSKGPAWIHLKTLKKREDAAKQWDERAEAILRGEARNLWDIFEERGFIKDVAGRPESIKELMRTKRIGAYVGVDPTAPSLHLGHLLPMMPVFWMYLHGYRAVTLIGGATARIGDPTGRLQSRETMSNSEIATNITRIHYQMKKLWTNVEAEKHKYGYQRTWDMSRHLVNNNTWWQSLSLYDVMKRLGRYVRMGPMLSRDTVKNKMEKGDGMSVAEFMYPLMQGWDWWHMYSKLGVQMQVGGSDQYGNIVTGIESIKTIRASETAEHLKIAETWKDDPIGFTVPLLTDGAGTKFGKTAGNAIWLDPTMTSAFSLYGYLVRRPDDEVEQLLKYFTFMPVPDITKLMEEHGQDPPKRVAQHKLAFEVLALVHGAEVATREQHQHRLMYSKGGAAAVPVPTGDPSEYQAADGRPVTPNNAPRMDMQLPRSVLSMSPAKILHATGLAASTSEGHRILAQSGAYVAARPGDSMRELIPGNLDWTPMKLWQPQAVQTFLIDGRVLILRKGKHNVRIIEMVSDEEWKASGKTYPGEPGTGKTRQAMAVLRELAEAEGKTLSQKELYRLAQEKLAAEEETTVVNNPDIRFPNKLERMKVLGELKPKGK